MCPSIDNRGQAIIQHAESLLTSSSCCANMHLQQPHPISLVCSFLPCRPQGETGSAASSAPDKDREPDPRMSAWLAAKEGNRDMLRAELEGGADIEHRDPMGRTALMEAAK